MNESITENTEPTPDKVRIAGQTLAFYWNTAKLPALIGAVLNIILIIANQPSIFLWGVYLVLFVYLAVWLRTRKMLTFGTAVTLGIVAGLMTGFIIACFRLLWEHHLYLIFNLITEPLLVAAGGVAFSALAVAGLGQRQEPKTATERRPRIRKGVNHNDR